MRNAGPFTVSSVIVFLFAAACQNNFYDYLPGEPEYWHIKPLGTPLYVYPDADYNIALGNCDTGKTAVFIDKNSTAEGVTVIAESSPEDYDDAVRIFNKKTDTVISMFFHKDQRFPWKIDIESGDKCAVGELSGYDWISECFSVEFNENDVRSSCKDIKLKRDVLTDYTFDTSISINQNIRIRNIYTALRIFEGISRFFVVNEKYFLHGMVNPDSILSSVFSDISIIAYGVTVTPVEPVINAANYFTGDSPLFVFSLLSSITSIFAKPASPPAPVPLSVTITKDGIPVDSETFHYIEKLEEITFDFVFTAGFNSNTNVSVGFYEPSINRYIGMSNFNAQLYSFTRPDDSPLGKFTEKYQIKVKRNWYTGYIQEGTTSLVIFFGQSTKVNGNSDGVYFQEPDHPEPKLNNTIFVINFTIVK